MNLSLKEIITALLLLVIGGLGGFAVKGVHDLQVGQATMTGEIKHVKTLVEMLHSDENLPAAQIMLAGESRAPSYNSKVCYKGLLASHSALVAEDYYRAKRYLETTIYELGWLCDQDEQGFLLNCRRD